MPLQFGRFKVHRLSLGQRLSLDRGVLTVDSDQIGSDLRARDPRITNVSIHVVHPGEPVRVVCAKDVIQPRLKLAGASPGSGVTHVVDGVAVVTCGPIVAFQEGIIDMLGPGAEHTPFSELALIVAEIGVAAGTSGHQHEASIRAAGLHVAEVVAQTCRDLTPDRVDEILWNESSVDSTLPRIAYVDMVLSQGLLHDTYVLGHNAQDGLPRVVDPRVVIDGGLVSGNCVSACDKNTTYHHQNNPVIERLLAGHGTRWNFVGVVITNEPTQLGKKRQSAERAVEMVRQLGAEGAVITKEGFGNPDADLMMIIRGLESSGIKTVAITDEFAGIDGSSQSLADATAQADALVSVGNANQRIELPPMPTVLGPLPDVTRLAGGYAGCLRSDGSMDVELQSIIGSTNQLGFSCLSCRDS